MKAWRQWLLSVQRDPDGVVCWIAGGKLYLEWYPDRRVFVVGPWWLVLQAVVWNRHLPLLERCSYIRCQQECGWAVGPLGIEGYNVRH